MLHLPTPSEAGLTCNDKIAASEEMIAKSVTVNYLARRLKEFETIGTTYVRITKDQFEEETEVCDSDVGLPFILSKIRKSGWKYHVEQNNCGEWSEKTAFSQPSTEVGWSEIVITPPYRYTKYL